MEDIAPQLLKEIEDVFKTKVKKDSYISKFLLKVQKGNVNFEDMQLYSKKLGELLGNTFVDVLKEDVLPDGKLYWNIAERTILPMLNNNYDLVTKASVEVQKIIDVKDGIGLKAIVPKRPDERIKGILDNVTVDGIAFSETQKRMKENTVNITEHFFDEFIKKNSEFRYKAGMNPQIIRVLLGKNPCNFCKSLAGTYDYEKVKNTGNKVFIRHNECHCQVIYKNNKQRYIQGVHTKRTTQKNINAKEILNLDKL